MAYDNFLAERIDRYFTEQNLDFYQKKMMGGLVFMVDEKMCVGLAEDKKTGVNQLMLRIGEEAYAVAIEHEHTKAMDFTKRPMKGYLYVLPDGYDLDEDLEYWLDLAIAFNPVAKRSKKNKK